MSNATLIEMILQDFGTGIQYPEDYLEQQEEDAKEWEDNWENDNYTETEF